jgi:hypothetical protein
MRRFKQVLCRAFYQPMVRDMAQWNKDGRALGV